MNAQFFEGDILALDVAVVCEFAGAIDVMVAGDFLHLFSWEGQVAAAYRIVRLARMSKGTMIIGKQRDGIMIVGKQIGRRTAGAIPS